MFCVECGEEKSIFRNGVCIDCYLESHQFTKGPKVIDIPVCKHCGALKYKNTWTAELLNDVLRRIIKNTFHISKELKKVEIDIDFKEQKENIRCVVYITGIIKDVKITEEHNVTVRFHNDVCDICSKQAGGYYEAIIQIRADKRSLTEEELDNISLDIQSFVEKLQSKGNRALFIANIKRHHGGLDFYISHQGSAQTILQETQERYGGEIKKSSKNIGMEDGQQIYRMTYLLRLPAFKKGGFIKQDNNFFYVSTISKNKIHLTSLNDWKEDISKVKNLEEAEVIGGEDLIKEMIVVNQKKNEIQVMDPDTYEINVIQKPKNIDFKSEKVKTVKTNDKIYLFPPKYI